MFRATSVALPNECEQYAPAAQVPEQPTSWPPLFKALGESRNYISNAL